MSGRPRSSETIPYEEAVFERDAGPVVGHGQYRLTTCSSQIDQHSGAGESDGVVDQVGHGAFELALHAIDKGVLDVSDVDADAGGRGRRTASVTTPERSIVSVACGALP